MSRLASSAIAWAVADEETALEYISNHPILGSTKLIVSLPSDVADISYTVNQLAVQSVYGRQRIIQISYVCLYTCPLIAGIRDHH